MRDPETLIPKKPKKKKKEKKSKKDNESHHDDAPSSEADPVTGSQKLKRKHLSVVEELDVKEAVKKRMKHKKEKNDSEADILTTGKEASSGSDCEKGKKKKKMRHKEKTELNECSNIITSTEYLEDEHGAVCVAKKKKRKKHKKEVNEEFDCEDSKVAEEEPSQRETTDETIHKKKKKKKKYRSLAADDSDGVENYTVTYYDKVDVGSSSKSKKKRKQEKSSECERIVQEDKDSDVDNSEMACDREVNGGSSSKSKKKKKKHNEEKMLQHEEMVQEGQCKKKKKKDNGARSGMDCGEKSKSYNSLPFNYDDGPDKPQSYNTMALNFGKAGESGNRSGPVCVGQWSTASLGSDDRQNKFLRLMGGFKKAGTSGGSGLFGKLGGGGSGGLGLWGKSSGGNAALNREEEEKMNNNLESEFDRALGFKFAKQKSAGLGFEAPPGEGKKFYIDKSSSKSLKFDDSD